MPSGPKKRRAAKKKTNVNSSKRIDLHHEEKDHILSALVERDEDLVLIGTDHVVELSEPIVSLSCNGDFVAVDHKVVSEDALESGSKDNVGMESINNAIDPSPKNSDNRNNELTEDVSDSNSNRIDPHLSPQDTLELGSKENERNNFIEDIVDTPISYPSNTMNPKDIDVNSSVGEDEHKESSQEVFDKYLDNETNPHLCLSRLMLVRALLSPSFLYTSCCVDNELSSKTYKLKGRIPESCCHCHENRDLDNHQGLDVPFAGTWHENKRRSGRQSPPVMFQATPPEEQGMTR